jgi:hypothetical protein
LDFFETYIVLAITHAILACFSSKWAQNVRIFKEYHVNNQSPQKLVAIGYINQFFVFEGQATATSWVQSGFSCIFSPPNWTLKHYSGCYPRHDIVEMFHDHDTAGHPDELGTYNSIHQHYWWPGLHTFVKNYVQGCGTCQQFKITLTPSKPAYMPTEGPALTWPFANCSIDLITDLPLANGFDSILVVVNQSLLKGVILAPGSCPFLRQKTRPDWTLKH